MARIPVGVQLYSVREDCERDLPGTLKAIAEMGYEGVEFAGYYGRSAPELRAMLDDLGLKVAGTHTGWRSVLDEELPRTIEFNQILGNRYLIVPGLPPERRSSRKAWLETAALFNEIAAKAEAASMQVGYHNHAVEFQALDGEVPWDTFFANTRPEVIMQLDLGNARHGGADPVFYLQKYPGRAITIHLKDYSATNDKALLGEGDVRWDEVFRICESTGGTQWYIVEQESYAYPPLECIRRCLEQVRRMGR
ncbi:MAG TPA: sugar phosphate isomerase/epimerase [Chloroflexota bacterium]|jgi:sugar phosphate isomerase/epimerase|nr:sugar phosphate isomerase/epimerase [Chloroflexota bacterium]